MSNNSIISVLFEEIKSRITSIENKIDKINVQGESESSPPADQPSPQKMVSVEKLVHYIQKTISYELKEELQRTKKQIRDSENDILNQIVHLTGIVQKLKCHRQKRQPIKFKLSKLAVVRIVFILVLVCSFTCNIFQLQENFRLSDNDIKFRYIKTVKGINSENLDRLENIFHISRDKELVDKIRQSVEEHESKVREWVKEIDENGPNENQPKF